MGALPAVRSCTQAVLPRERGRRIQTGKKGGLAKWRGPATGKVGSHLGAVEKISDEHEEHRMKHHLLCRVEEADCHMEGEPGQGEPARPVSAEEHEDPTHNRQ